MLWTTDGDEGVVIRAETWKAIASVSLSDEEEEEGSSTPVGIAEDPASHHVSIRQSNVIPHPTLSDTTIVSRKPPLHRLSSQASDPGGCESRISLPEICSSPLINMPQGGASHAPNNSQSVYRNSRGGVRATASLESMVYNDLSRDSPHSLASSSGHRMTGTPLSLEDVGSQGQTTPVPQPPPLVDRRSGQRPSRKASSEVDPKTWFLLSFCDVLLLRSHVLDFKCLTKVLCDIRYFPQHKTLTLANHCDNSLHDCIFSFYIDFNCKFVSTDENEINSLLKVRD